MRETLSSILGASLTDLQWEQSQLPVSMGGVGLRSAVKHSSAAYLSSILASESLKDAIIKGHNIEFSLDCSIALLNQQTEDPDSRESLLCLPQKALSLKVDLAAQRAFQCAFRIWE